MKTGGPKKTIIKQLKNIWYEFLYSGSMVTLADIFVLLAVAIVLQINIPISFIIVIFLSILAINFFNRSNEIESDIITNPKRTNYHQKYSKYKTYIMFISIALSVIITLLFASTGAVILMGILYGLGFLYTIYLKRFTSTIIGFKNFIAGLAYALLVIFMALFTKTPVTYAVYFIALFYFMRMYTNTVFFDIKDIESDKREGLKTLPVVFGELRTKKILRGLNLLSAIPILIGIYTNNLPFYSIALLFTLFYTGYFYRSVVSIKQEISYIVIDGCEFILWLPCVLIGKALL
jgi:4-hydroxybenzoate polyprenyltransferase